MTVGRRRLVDRLATYDSLTEVAIGERTDVAAALAERGRRVRATDVREVGTPDGVRFVADDVLARSDAATIPAVYRSAALYALNLPRELHRPTLAVARRVGADLLFTTLGFEEPAVAVRRETVGGGAIYSRPTTAKGSETPPGSIDPRASPGGGGESEP